MYCHTSSGNMLESGAHCTWFLIFGYFLSLLSKIASVNVHEPRCDWFQFLHPTLGAMGKTTSEPPGRLTHQIFTMGGSPWRHTNCILSHTGFHEHFTKSMEHLAEFHGTGKIPGMTLMWDHLHVISCGSSNMMLSSQCVTWLLFFLLPPTTHTMNNNYHPQPLPTEWQQMAATTHNDHLQQQPVTTHKHKWWWIPTRTTHNHHHTQKWWVQNEWQPQPTATTYILMPKKSNGQSVTVTSVEHVELPLNYSTIYILPTY